MPDQLANEPQDAAAWHCLEPGCGAILGVVRAGVLWLGGDCRFKLIEGVIVCPCCGHTRHWQKHAQLPVGDA